MNARNLIAALLLFFGLSAMASQPIQSLEEIRDTARRFVTAHLTTGPIPPLVEVGRIDARLRLQPCASELTAFLSSGNARVGNTTVGIRCVGPKPWSLFVPVRVKLNAAVVVLARPAPQGAVLTDSDIRLEERDIAKLVSGYFTDPAQVIGKQLKQSLGIGQAVSHLAVKEPRLVRRGERVVLLASSAGFEVRMEGTLLMDGAVGDRVRVRNLNSKRVVEGIVTQDGAVQVRM